ncbi:hypothetical protein [Bacillus sonorensis]|uniref:hypothetical protein n=1 Tax=Bacillus sonorensis TaxID=119858 RepID=UPI002DBB537B|nr:hypothetical protein [Bacillus sonorensis]MEC0341858.1 hypothetical protein [Bacillus sonorensis]MEC0457456.1 hypothetical protein [Bacillus sonorensis]MEC0530749.1 hypothetical protein [Bacillus sonorensis]
MKKKTIKLLLVLMVAIGSFASIGFVSSDIAHAKDSTLKYKSGILVHREGKLKYKKPTYSNTFGYYQIGTIFTSITTYRSGKVKATLQYKTKKGWKNYKTYYVTKKGSKYFHEKSYLSLKTKFRFKFENKGSKKAIPYNFMSNSRLKFSQAEEKAYADLNPAKTKETIRKTKFGVDVSRQGNLFYKKAVYTNTFGYGYAYKMNGVVTGSPGTSIWPQRSGKIKATLQYKSKKGWKDYKTFYVTKKGITFFKVNVRNLDFNTKFRYKLENIGSKNPIPYIFSSTTPYKY